MAEESADKKGYHLYLTIEVMKSFKKMCIEKGVPVAHQIEKLMIQKLEEENVESNRKSRIS